MPVYTYHCDNCGVEFDRSQKFTEASLTRCPECGRKTLHKVYSAVGIVFKGSGFYATDHRSPSGMSAKSDAKEEKAAAAEKSDAAKPVETKPAAEKPAPTPAKSTTNGKES